jgi:hemoglobin-like flavoprotein
MREKIFVSYSHKDSVWLERLRGQLGAGIYKEAFEIWSDLAIETGANWKEQIQAAIASSRIALLLVSKHFLASDFIINDELPSILRLNESNEAGGPEGLNIWWVPLENVTEAELRIAGIGSIQAAVASPSRPLGQLKGKELDDAIRKLSLKLMKQLKLLTDVSAGARDQFKLEVTKALGSVNTRIEESLAPGDYSILYRAKRLGDEVAVKAMFPLPGREWMGRDFIDRARSVRKVRNATAIGIRDIVDRETKCVVMEYVNAPTLKVQLNEHGGRLSCERTVDVLAQLAGVAADLHQMDGQPIIGPIRPSRVHHELATKKARISLVHIANETLLSCLQRPTLLLDSDAFTYLIPERYFGRKVEPPADQYYLGLLALELLQGKPPVEVSAFSDLETKRKFFDAPRAFFADLPVQQPAFSFVLTKMLEQDPQNRWTSMSELAEALRQVAAGIVPAAVKRLAVEDYESKLHNNGGFFDSFYRGLFNRSEEIREIFVRRGVTMEEQYKKLDGAVHYLFLFDRSIKLTALDQQAENHRRLGLKPEHFDAFRAAFLEALRQAEIADAYSQDAWRAILDPALAFMREKTCGEAVKLVS